MLLLVYLLYMVAMYLKDLKEEKEEVKVEAVVLNRNGANTTDSGKDKSVVLLLNDERVSKVDVKDKGGEGEEKDGEDKSEEGEGEKEVRVGGELSEEVDRPSNWLRNKTEVRLWIGEM